ncbi:KxYKxGKxW signal peptide domain-containing protein, partial [Lacticaseibacillus rhamnosus]
MGEKKLHYKMYKDGKKFVFAAIATLSFFVFGGVSTVAVHADTTSRNLTTATVNSSSDTKSAVSSVATVASSSSAVKADSTGASSSAVKADSTGASSSAVKADTTSASSSSAAKAETTSVSNSSAVKAETTSVSNSSAVKAETTSVSNSSAANAETTGASSSSAVKTETASASNSSAANTETASASNSSAVEAETASASNSSAVKAETTNASSSSAVKAETTSASNSSAANAETTSASSSSAANAETASASNSSAVEADAISAGGNQIVAQIATNVSKNDAIVTTKFAQNYGRRVLAGSVTNTGFSVSDPDYPSGMWIDPDKSHYSYEWLQTYSGNQIVLSTNRTGDGIVYVTELSSSNAVLQQYTLNQNTKVPSAIFDSTTYYNDTYYAMVESSRDPLAVKYIASKYDSGYYNRLSYMVPKLITQTTHYVDKDGKQITDSNGNPVVAYTQKGLVGQNYTTSDVNVINGYYAIAPSNSNGVMSPYGEIGASYVKNFHDGIVITYTQTGSDGTMSASIAQYGEVLQTWTNIKPSDPAIKYRVGSTTSAIKNPYIPQTSDVVYVYSKLGNWVVSNPDGSTKSIIYPNDPSDPTKIADSSVPGYPVIDFLPGYTPEDHMGTPLVPVDPDDRTKGYIPPIPSDNGT